MSRPEGGPPAYPNLETAIGTSVPVVTTVLAAIGTATYVVPLQDAASGGAPALDPLPLSYPQLAVLLGTFATGCFVVATLAAVHAHATTFDALVPERRAALLAGLEDEEERLVVTGHYRRETQRRYELARTLWMVGLGLLALATGALAQRLLEPMVPVAALAGLAVAIATLRDDLGWVGRLCGLVVLVASLAFGATLFL